MTDVTTPTPRSPAGPPSGGWWSRPAENDDEAPTRPVPPYHAYSPSPGESSVRGPAAHSASEPVAGPGMDTLDDDPWSLTGDAAAGVHEEPKPARERRRPGWLAVGAATVLAGVTGGLVGAALAPAPVDAEPTAETSTVSLDPVVPDRSAESVAGIAEAALPSVVSINTSTGSGSGFIITDDGYIVTNHHVIADSGADGVQVSLQDGRTVEADIVGTSPAYDLAVLDVELLNHTPLALGDSDEVTVGDPLVAVGSPLGLEGTVTSGIVSAADRPVTAGGQGEVSFINALQTDAAINPGNSGGPLLDASGRVIGVNSSIAVLPTAFGGQSGSIGLGFSIPINQARVTAEQIIADGEASYPIIGATLEYGPVGQGAVVASVVPTGPAAEVGLRGGDRIVAIDGRPVLGSDELIVAIRARQPGDTVELTIDRGGVEDTLEVTLGSRVG